MRVPSRTARRPPAADRRTRARRRRARSALCHPRWRGGRGVPRGPPRPRRRSRRPWRARYTVASSHSASSIVHTAGDRGMTQPTDTSRILIVGGGVAALETLLALRDLAEDRVALTLVAPEAAFTYRPMRVAEPFALGR